MVRIEGMTGTAPSLALGLAAEALVGGAYYKVSGYSIV